MFKKIAIFFVTLGVSVYLISLPFQVQANIVETPVTKLSNLEYANSITLNGTVEGADSHNLFLAIPIIPNEVYAKQGQRVSKGDLLFTVDIDQLKEYLEKALVAGGDSADLLNYISEFLNTEEKIEKAMRDIKTHYYAEKDGVISSLNIEKNTLSNPLLPILSITNSKQLVINADLPAEQANIVSQGQRVAIDLKNGAQSTYSGKVKQVSGIAKTKLDGTKFSVFIPVEIEIETTDNDIIPGLKAEVKIQTEREKNISFLPYASISQDDKGEYVYVLKGPKIEKKYIEVGEDLEEGVEVVSGVSQEDIVIKDIAKIKHQNQTVKVVKE